MSEWGRWGGGKNNTFVPIQSTQQSDHNKLGFFCDKGIWNKEAILEIERNLFRGLHTLVIQVFIFFSSAPPCPPPPLSVTLIYPKMK